MKSCEFFCRFSFFIDNEKMTTPSIIPIDKLASPGNHQYSSQNNGHEDEDKIVQEFSHLLEKSKQLFNGLR